jgi:hypothetical protein
VTTRVGAGETGDLDRPMKLGEVLAETIRLYGRRFWAAIAIGAFFGGVFVLAVWIHDRAGLVPYAATLAAGFTPAFAASVRVAAGDSLAEAARRVVRQLPLLAVLTVAVVLPLVVSLSFLILLLVAAAWLGAAGFAVPVAMVEEGKEPGAIGRLAFIARRTLTLARAEYVHAAGVAAALIILYILLGILLSGTLIGFAENRDVEAALIVQVVLAPFFFLGLSVLYFDQRARLAARR